MKDTGAMNMTKPVFRAICYLLWLCPMSGSLSQTPLHTNDTVVNDESAFDAVSIRKSAKEGYSHWRTGEDGYSATNVTARQIIFYAYAQTDSPDAFSNIISMDQISGLPKWADAEQFDVTAKVDGPTVKQLSLISERARRKQYQQMLQSALAERFHLEIRREKRSRPVYLLQPLQNGNKLAESNVPFNKSSLSVGRGEIRAQGYTIGELLGYLTDATGRMVIDQTHLAGTYDVQLKWRPDDDTGATNTSPSIFTAVKEQLGLSLTSSKEPVDTLVVTHLEQPTSN